MAERNVAVRLSANVSSYVAGMKEAAKQTWAVDESMSQLDRRKKGLETLGKAGLGLGTAVAAGAALAVKTFADFDEAMSAVSAATLDSSESAEAAADRLGKLREAAVEAGADTVYSAEEAAGAIEELAKAGVSTEDILGGGLTGALDLAAAGAMSVSDAASVTSTTLQQFQLDGAQASHVADLLAAGAGKAMGDVSDLGEAMKYVGPLANSMGVGVEEVTGTLALLAQQGILGSQAGTSLRAILASLTAPTKASAKEMERLGLNMYDAQGQFIGIESAAGQLQEKFGAMTDAEKNASMGLIFGREASTAATILINEGAEGVKEWTTAVDDAGFASRVAGERLDNLKGDWEGLTGSLDTLLITMGEGANGPLRSLVQGLESAVDWFNDLPAPIQQTLGLAGGLLGTVGLLGGAFVTVAPKVLEMKANFQALGLSGDKMKGRLGGVANFLGGPWGVALAAGVTATMLLDKALEKVQATSEEMQNALKTASDADTIWDTAKAGRALDFFGTVSNDIDDFAEKLDKSTELNSNFWAKFDPRWNRQEMTAFAETVTAISDELGALAQQDLPSAQEAFKKLADQTGLSEKQTWNLLDQMPAYRDAVQEQATALGLSTQEMSDQERQSTLTAIAMGDYADNSSDAADAAGDAGSASAVAAAELEEVKLSAEDAAEQLEDLIDALRNYSTVAGNVQAAQDALTHTIEDSKDALKKFLEDGGHGSDVLNELSAKGADMRDTLRDLSQGALDAGADILASGGSMDEANEAYARGRDRIMEILDKLGISGDEAQEWADKMFGSGQVVEDQMQAIADAQDAIDETTEIVVKAETKVAQAKLDELHSRLLGIQDKTVKVTAEYYEQKKPGWGVLKPGASVNPQGQGLSIPGVDGNANGGLYDYAGLSAKVKAFANGGFAGPGIYPGGANIHKFAEPETGWEAYISGKPSERDRNRGILAAAAGRLGMDLGGGGDRRTVTVNQSFNIPAGMTPQQVRQIGDRGVLDALR